MFNSIKRMFDIGYKYHPDAIIIACYFNPQNNIYRKKAFDIWYQSIKHLNHRIIECSIAGSDYQLPNNSNFVRVETETLLWHKATLLNKLIWEIIEEGKYSFVFWLDTDIIFQNKNWLVEGCDQLKTVDVIQPFSYCTHLERDQLQSPPSQISEIEMAVNDPILYAKTYKSWHSFCSNIECIDTVDEDYNMTFRIDSKNYDIHGHVGFAWGATTKCLQKIGGLFDKALVGGADHIMAHAFANHVPCSCIERSFGDNLPEIKNWTEKAAMYVNRNIGYVNGRLLHIWHGDIEKREYFKRVKEFTPLSSGKIERTESGFFASSEPSVTNYADNYFQFREVTDMLIDTVNPDSLFDTPLNDSEFEGGQFGGSGAGSDWETFS